LILDIITSSPPFLLSVDFSLFDLPVSSWGYSLFNGNSLGPSCLFNLVGDGMTCRYNESPYLLPTGVLTLLSHGISFRGVCSLRISANLSLSLDYSEFMFFVSYWRYSLSTQTGSLELCVAILLEDGAFSLLGDISFFFFSFVSTS
jgi:hypothetical protein